MTLNHSSLGFIILYDIQLNSFLKTLNLKKPATSHSFIIITTLVSFRIEKYFIVSQYVCYHVESSYHRSKLFFFTTNILMKSHILKFSCFYQVIFTHFKRFQLFFLYQNLCFTVSHFLGSEIYNHITLNSIPSSQFSPTVLTNICAKFYSNTTSPSPPSPDLSDPPKSHFLAFPNNLCEQPYISKGYK